MNTIFQLSGPLLGFWLAIVGVAIASGVVCAIVGSLRRRGQHRHRTHNAPSPGR